MHFEPVCKWTQKCTCWPWMCELRDEFGGCEQVSLERYMNAMINQVYGYTWREWWCEIGDCVWARLRTQLEAIIMQTWRPWSKEYGDALGCSRFGGSKSECRRNWSWDCIYWLTCNCGNAVSWVHHGLPRDERWEMRHWLGVEDSRSWNDAVLGATTSWYMQHSA